MPIVVDTDLDSPRRFPSSAAPKERAFRRAFTMMETLVLIGIFIILLSIFIPYLSSLRESSRRAACADNLRQIRDALQQYAHDNNSDFPRVVYDPTMSGYTAFTGADAASPFAKNSPVKANDVTASLWLLIRAGLLNNPRVFICPSSDDQRDLITSASNQLVKPTQRSNFRYPINLSYSYACPFSSAPGFVMNDTKPSDFALMADKNPGQAATQVPQNASPDDYAKANSPNHNGAGENVLFADGSVAFVRNPYCGVGRGPNLFGDNIYTARAAKPTTQASELPPNVNGVVGMNVSPVRNDDSYLVPTADFMK
jgi:prepilin-type processing-associated H-X9-DG protein